MNKIISLALVATVAGGLFAAPGFAKDSDLCGPNGPEAYKRPGGYCEQIKDKKSLGGSEKTHEWGLWDLLSL